MKPAYYRLAKNSLKKKTESYIKKQNSEINFVPPISTNQVNLQFDHPDAMPYLFSARLNSQNCLSARRGRKKLVPIESLPNKQNINTNNLPTTAEGNKFFENSENSNINSVSKNNSASESRKKMITSKTAYNTSYDREKGIMMNNSKIPNGKQLQYLKNQIDSIRPHAIMWANTSDSLMNHNITEEIRKPEEEIKRKRIIVDNEPIDINQKPIPAPLISTKAYCQDFVGVPNSLSFIL